MTQLLADGRARCGCARPERDLRQRVQEACGSWVATQVGALTREVAERDEERITACLDRIARAASACSLDEAMTDCHDLLREPASLGDECGGAAALCRRGVCSDGTCVPQPRPGEPAVGGLCAPGLVVDDGTCVERRREGARCRDEICEFGLYCIGYVCTRPRPAGGACESTGDCDDGLLCRDGRCVAAPRWCEHQDACGWAYACDETFASHCVPCADCQGETVCADDETVCGEGRACEDESRGGRCAPELCGDDALPEVFRR